MNILRAFLYQIFTAIMLVPLTMLILVASCFLKGRALYRVSVPWLYVCRFGLRLFCGISVRVHGEENITSTNPAVLMCKHQSAMETLILPTVMPQHQLAFVFKRELLFIPFFGWAMARQDMIFIDRGRSMQALRKILTVGKRLLSSGAWVVVFPEGTRVARGQKGAYKTGGARLALDTAVPVVAVAVTSARVWPSRSFLKLRPGVMDVSFSPPMDTAGRSAQAITDAVEEWIEREMTRLDPPPFDSP